MAQVFTGTNKSLLKNYNNRYKIMVLNYINITGTKMSYNHSPMCSNGMFWWYFNSGLPHEQFTTLSGFKFLPLRADDSVQLVNLCPQVSPALLCFLYLAGQFIHLIALGDDNLHQLFTIPLLFSRYAARSLIFVPNARMSGTLPKKLGLSVFFERTSDTTWASLLRPPSVVGTESCFSISS